jgi:light-regulated signal transduction histidine kinase (bacteriophytochrome)
MDFYYSNKKAQKVFISDSLEEVELKAKEYKEDNGILALQIQTGKGEFFKWA